ncbi:MFS transporter [Peribacillus sp. TH27]|uniref:MFS transporter n=1 Tax=Peribacillus sp. TH27 TaxID=2798484 RepID=UPI00191231B2|nr:MFS transporter [Peribacillus sp. TH27]MBK5458831.1 MFS transporter [Peribacillus sp. TH27]
MAIRGSLARRKYLHIILPLFIGSLLAYLDRLNLSYAALTMNEQLGFSAEVFGMGAGILFAGYVLFEIPGSVYAEKKSPSKWLVRIMVTWGLSCALMAFIKTPGQFYIVRFLIGAAEASFYPVCYSVIIPRWFNMKERPAALSIMVTSLIVSSIIGAPLAGLLIGLDLDFALFTLHGWQILFLLEGVLAVGFGIFLLYWLKDWPKDAKWMTEEERKATMQEYEQEVAAKSSVKQYTIWQVFADKTVIKLCLIYFLWISGFWAFGFWLPTVLRSVSGLSNSGVSFLTLVPMTIGLIGFIINGVTASKSGKLKRHIATPLFIGAFGMAAGTFTSNPTLSLIFISITCLGVYIGQGCWWSVPTTFLSGSAAAAATALINSIGNIGGWVGPYLVGFSQTSTGSYQMAYLILAASLAIAGVLTLTLKDKSSAVSGVNIEKENAI